MVLFLSRIQLLIKWEKSAIVISEKNISPLPFAALLIPLPQFNAS
jgi:hypothetical protein